MSVERNGNETGLQCDRCASAFGPYIVRDPEDFTDMITDARTTGWAVFQKRGEWRHECPDCRKSEDFEHVRL